MILYITILVSTVVDGEGVHAGRRVPDLLSDPAALHVL